MARITTVTGLGVRHAIIWRRRGPGGTGTELKSGAGVEVAGETKMLWDLVGQGTLCKVCSLVQQVSVADICEDLSERVGQGLS